MKILKSISFIFVYLFSIFACAQDKEVIIKTHKVTDNIFMLEGQGGNIGVFIGDDGVFVIDDQFAHLATKIESAIKELSDKSITFLVNTHYHGDHVGGNEAMANKGTTIISHDNVRKRLAEKPNHQEEMMPQKDLPVITFNDKLSLHINGEDVLVFHAENAHTDGDAMLYFTESNVLHTGDIFFNKRYPYVDIDSGGSVNGYIEAVERALIVINDDTKVIPGHGKLSNANEYKTFLKMMKQLKENVLSEIEKGKTEEEVASNNSITKVYDDLNYGSGFINSEKIRRTFYKSLKR